MRNLSPDLLSVSIQANNLARPEFAPFSIIVNLEGGVSRPMRGSNPVAVIQGLLQADPDKFSALKFQFFATALNLRDREGGLIRTSKQLIRWLSGLEKEPIIRDSTQRGKIFTTNGANLMSSIMSSPKV